MNNLAKQVKIIADQLDRKDEWTNFVAKIYKMFIDKDPKLRTNHQFQKAFGEIVDWAMNIKKEN